jgi:uncharacterized protein (TIGR02611 family)
MLVECRSMIQWAKDTWRRFKQSKPGHRFQDHHRYQQDRIGRRSYLRVFFGIVGGFLVVVGGLIAVPGPGPGWLVILLGLGMVAGESLFFARLLDRVEVKLRGFVRRVVGAWRTSHILVKVVIVLMILTCAIVMGIGFIF